MKKLLPYLFALAPFASFAQTNDWAVCDLLSVNNAKIEEEQIGDAKFFNLAVVVENISPDDLPEAVCVYASIDGETLTGGSCFPAFASGDTRKATFQLDEEIVNTDFVVEVKLKSNLNDEEYCLRDINVASLNVEELDLQGVPFTVSFFDITGRVVNQPTRDGLYIRQKNYENGVQLTEKVYFRN